MMSSSTLLTRVVAGDRALFLRCLVAPSAPRTRRLFWTAVTHLGGATSALVASLAPYFAGGTVADAGRRSLLILICSHLVVQIVKRLGGRERPSNAIDCAALIDEPDRYSFPSGHSAAAMAVALGYAITFPSLGVPLVSFAMLVGASRVALGVHYPSDVVAGQLISVITAIVVRLF